MRCRLSPTADVPSHTSGSYVTMSRHRSNPARYLSGFLAAVREAAVAIECETEMRSQRSDSRVLLRIRIGIGCGNDDDPEPATILATRRQHRCSQCIALPVAQREEKRHLSLYMGLEADVALDRVGPLRTPGLDCLLPLAAEIFLDCVAHQARLMRRFTFRLNTEPGLTLRRVANILHFARPAIAAILGRRACKANMRFAPVNNTARSYNRKFVCNTAIITLPFILRLQSEVTRKARASSKDLY